MMGFFLLLCLHVNIRFLNGSRSTMNQTINFKIKFIQ
jgi:hypothetical protein